jgi:hypothetical protein
MERSGKGHKEKRAQKTRPEAGDERRKGSRRRRGWFRDLDIVRSVRAAVQDVDVDDD